MLLVSPFKCVAQSRCLRTGADRLSTLRVNCYQTEPDKPNNSVSREKLRDSLPVKYAQPFFEHAESDLESYCKKLGNSEEQLKCWRAYGSLRRKHRDLAAGCSQEKEQGQFGSRCDELVKLEQMIRELEYQGDLDSMYRTLALLDDIETHGHSDEGRRLSPDHLQEENALLRERAIALFKKFDLDGNEKMDVSEFREAFKQLNTELSGHEVEQICDTMDLHGYVTMEQFVDVVAAEKFRLLYPDSDAAFLRKVTHARPGWWTERSGAIDNV